MKLNFANDLTLMEKTSIKLFFRGGGGITQNRVSHYGATCLMLVVPKIFILDVADIYQWHWLEKSGLIQRFGNVDRTHLALAS